MFPPIFLLSGIKERLRFIDSPYFDNYNEFIKLVNYLYPITGDVLCGFVPLSTHSVF